MGFPFDQATWNVVSDAMYVGAGSGAPGFYTLLGIVILIGVLWFGNKTEQARYAEQDE